MTALPQPDNNEIRDALRKAGLTFFGEGISLPDGVEYVRMTELGKFLAVVLPALAAARKEGQAEIATAINTRLDVMVHPYGDKSLPKWTERASLRDLYGDDIVDDLEAILALSVPVPVPTPTEKSE